MPFFHTAVVSQLCFKTILSEALVFLLRPKITSLVISVKTSHFWIGVVQKNLPLKIGYSSW